MQAAFLAKSVEADELRRELTAERAMSAGQQAELERQLAALQRQLAQSEERVRTGEGIVSRMSAFLKSGALELNGGGGGLGFGYGAAPAAFEAATNGGQHPHGFGYDEFS